MLKNNLIRYGVAFIIGGGALLGGLLSYGNLKANSATATGDVEEEDKGFQIDLEKEFGDKVDQNYTFEPTEFKLSIADNELATLDKKTLKTTVPTILGDDPDKPAGTATSYTTKRRVDADGNEIHKVYTFDGLTAEGYHGDYSTVEAHITCWEDGTYVGISRNDKIYGYWYNVDEEGSDCLVMISASDDHDMVCLKNKGDGFYPWTVDVFVNYGWGTRMIKVNGAPYYPVIGMYIDTGSSEKVTIPVGGTFDTKNWTAKQVTNKLVAGSIFNATDYVKYTLPSTEEAGTKEVTAKWTLYGEEFQTCSFEVEVVAA